MTFGLEFQKYIPGQLMAKGRRSMRREHVPSPTARTSNIPTSCAQDPINNHLLSNGVLDTLKKARGVSNEDTPRFQVRYLFTEYLKIQCCYVRFAQYFIHCGDRSLLSPI